MAYATPEDTAYLQERGWTVRDSGHGEYTKLMDGGMHYIVPQWEGRQSHKLDVPPGDQVYWLAMVTHLTSVDSASASGLRLAVKFSDRIPTPIAAFVTAEIRNWRHEP